jgi:cytochrome d ubiquinol oxidase subunit II
VMTIVALVFLPLVVLYQGWTYYVFRQRMRTPGEQAPVAPAGSGPTTPTVAQT